MNYQSLVKASAGSGKTHLLSGHILSLLCEGENASKILASTFTRKAAGEMFERVVNRLLQAIESETNRKRFLSEIDFEENKINRSQLIDTLENLIKEQSKSKISTLDSFFVSIAQAFFTELSLPSTWKIADTWDLIEIENEALEKTISSLGQNTLGELLSLINSERGPRSLLHAPLLDEVSTLYYTFLGSPPKAWGAIECEEVDTNQRIVENIISLLETDHNLEVQGVKADSRVLTAAKKLALLLREENWHEILATSLTYKIYIEEDYTYYKKPIPEKIIEGITLLVELSCKKIKFETRNKTLALAAIASEYAKMISIVSNQKGLMSFHNLTHTLSTALDDIKLEDIYYRLDSKISHLLLDEFQDTSPIQWKILEPLATEILSKISLENTFLVVGDVKQAIYSWRGGTSELFDVLLNSYPQLSDHQRTLKKTYRSYPGIIDCVNSIFASLGENPALINQRNAAKKWSSDFPTHESAKNEQFGKIVIKSVLLEENEDTQRASKQESVTAIQKELFEDILPFLENTSIHSIGILCRTNTQVNLLERFFQEKGIEVSGEGGEPLSNSLMIQLLISALTLAEHPGDTFSYKHLIESNLRPYLQKLLGAHSIEKTDAKLLSRILYSNYIEVGLELFVRNIIHAMTPFLDELEIRRATFVLTLALGFERKGGKATADFITILKYSFIESPASNKIRIMTYHKSKGLEFDAVFIPFTDDKFYKSANVTLLKKQSSPIDPPEVIVKNVKSDSRRFLPEFEEMYQDTTRNLTLEGLSTTYVALTRAIHSMFIYLLPYEPKKAPSKIPDPDMASIIRGAFGYFEHLPPSHILYENSAPFPSDDNKNKVYAEHKHNLNTDEDSIQEEISAEIPSFASNKNIHRTYPSAKDQDPLERVKESLEMNKGSDFGTKVHAILQNIRWLGSSSDIGKLIIQEDEKRYLASALSHQKIYDLFQSSTFLSNKNEVASIDTEIPFSMLSQGELLSGRLDRLVLTSTDGKVVSAAIIDFKTGKSASEKLLKSQDTAYRAFVSKKYKLSSEKIKTYFAFLSTGEVLVY